MLCILAEMLFDALLYGSFGHCALALSGFLVALAFFHIHVSLLLSSLLLISTNFSKHVGHVLS